MTSELTTPRLLVEQANVLSPTQRDRALALLADWPQRRYAGYAPRTVAAAVAYYPNADDDGFTQGVVARAFNVSPRAIRNARPDVVAATEASEASEIPTLYETASP